MKTLNLTLILLIPLIFMGCNDTDRQQLSPTNEEMTLEVTLERNLTSEHPLDIIVKLTNLGEHTVYYSDYSLPYVNGGISGDFFTVLEDGVKVDYKGILFSSSGTIFASIDAGKTKVRRISLDKHYMVHQGTHNYYISRSDSGIWAKTIDGRAEAYTDEDVYDLPNALAPDEHTSEYTPVVQNTLEFEATLHTVRENTYKKY